MSKPVCIIDDDDDVRGVMCFALEFEGIDALPYSSGLVAARELALLTPDEWPCLIIVDYMMPDMNGVEFISKIFKDFPDTLAKIPIALSTARFEDETEDLPQGALRLEKPVNLPKFISLARELSSQDAIGISFAPLS